MASGGSGRGCGKGDQGDQSGMPAGASVRGARMRNNRTAARSRNLNSSPSPSGDVGRISDSRGPDNQRHAHMHHGYRHDLHEGAQPPAGGYGNASYGCGCIPNMHHSLHSSAAANQMNRGDGVATLSQFCPNLISHSPPDGDDDFRFIEPSHPSRMLAGLDAMRKSGQFCDVILLAEDTELPAHRIVLSSLSAYFSAMFASEMAEKRQDRVTINGVEVGMLQLIVDYAYTAEINITKSNVQSLLSAANLLQVIPVREACCRFMLRHMDESNVIGVHCFAEAHDCNDLAVKAKDFILDSFLHVCKQEEFLELNEEKLIEIFANNDIYVESEETIFLAAIRWLEHNRTSRAVNFDRVLEHVRLPLVSPYFLHDCVDKQSIIRENSRCRDLLDEAVAFHLLPDRRHEMRNSRTKPRKASGLVEVIILVGGEDDKVVLRSVESFDPATHAWKTLPCLPFAVSKHGIVASGSNCMFLAGGEFPDGSASRSLWKFDPSYEVWQELGSMNVPRSELGLALLDGSIYAVGGWEGSHRLDSVERYNRATNTWSMIANLKMAVTSPAVVALEGLLYVTGGAVLEDGDGIPDVQCFDPKTSQWKELQSMLIPRSGSAACSLNGHLYIIGGWHASTENTNKVERYDPSKDEWQSVASMNERRYRPGVAVIDGKIYVCGGEEGWDRYHDTIESYNSETDKWEVVGEMPSSRSWLSCVALQIKKDHSAVCGEVGVKERSNHGSRDIGAL